MKIVATMPVRNEAWVLGLSARALLRWVDHLVILEHASTADDTKGIVDEIAVEHPGRVNVLTERDPTWEEMRHRQRLLDEARKQGATHIAMVDADEVLSANLLPVIRDFYAALLPCEVLQIPWLCLRGSLDSVHTQGMWAEQSVSCGFLDDHIWHWSSGERGGYDFHHRHPMGRQLRTVRPAGRGAGLMHLQFVSDRRLRAKQYLYQLTERLRWPDKFTAQEIRARYSATVHAHNGHVGTPVPLAWWQGYEDLMPYLRIDEEPWQLAECVKILRENPGIERGLDDFGLFSGTVQSGAM